MTTISPFMARQASSEETKLDLGAGSYSNNKCGATCTYNHQSAGTTPCVPTTKKRIRQGFAQRSSKKRSISFHSSVKTWDGVCTLTQNLQHLVWEFWSKGSCTHVLNGFIRQRRYIELCALCKGVRETIERIKQLGTRKSTPLTPQGGGKMIMLRVDHLPNLIRLFMMVKRARDQCRPKPKPDRLPLKAVPPATAFFLQAMLDEITDF